MSTRESREWDAHWDRVAEDQEAHTNPDPETGHPAYSIPVPGAQFGIACKVCEPKGDHVLGDDIDEHDVAEAVLEHKLETATGRLY